MGMGTMDMSYKGMSRSFRSLGADSLISFLARKASGKIYDNFKIKVGGK